MKKTSVASEGDDFLDEAIIAELERALAESREDIAAGRFVIESPAAHVARITQRPTDVSKSK